MSDGRPYLQASSSEPTYIDFVMATMTGLLTLHENRIGNAVESGSRITVRILLH